MRIPLSVLILLIDIFCPAKESDLTDAQRRESQRYLHTSKQKRLTLEGCLEAAGSGLDREQLEKLSEDIRSGDMSAEQRELVGKSEKLCSGNAEASALGIDENMVQTASKMWSIVMGAGGGGMAMEEVPQGEEKKKLSDPCRFIPMGTELVAQFQQRTFQAHIQDGTHPQDNVQYASLMKVARSYGSRSDRAKSQAIGWGVTASCYALLMTKSGVQLNPAKGWKNYLKVGASAFMTLYYSKLIGVHAKRAEALRTLAKSLPGRGDCNPITDRNCYCTEPTTKNDPKHCLPSMLGQNLPPQLKGARKQACIDADAQADPQCHCVARNDCLDKGIEVVFSGADIPGAKMDKFSRDLKGLTRGTLDAGQLANVEGANKHAAAAIEFLGAQIPEVPDDRPLSQWERGQSQLLKDMGIPAKMARGLALHKPSRTDVERAKKYTSSLASAPVQKSASIGRISEGVVDDYKGGSPRRKRRKRKGDGQANPFAKFLGKKKGGASHTGRVLSFAEEATQKAGIHQKPEISLFALVSRRYRTVAQRMVGKEYP